MSSEFCAFQQEPEFQLEPLPTSNPILEGVRWKQYHAALGETLQDLPKESWDVVKEEKADDMIHVLDFPYNGEPPRVSHGLAPGTSTAVDNESRIVLLRQRSLEMRTTSFETTVAYRSSAKTNSIWRSLAWSIYLRR